MQVWRGRPLSSKALDGRTGGSKVGSVPPDVLERDGLSLGDLLTVSPLESLAVVLSTIGMYLAMLLLVRLLGPRMLSGMSGFDLVALIAFGAVIGRSALGEFPAFSAGLIALATLVVLQGLVGTLRQTRLGMAVVDSPPVLLMAGGRLLEANMARAHVLPGELQSRLRLAGVRNFGEVAAVVLEPTGAISVLRRGEVIDPQLLSGVVGAAEVPEDLLAVDPSGPERPEA